MLVNLVDFIIMGIILLSVFSGMNKGFIDALGGIIGIILAIFLGGLYYDECAGWLETNFGLTTKLATIIHQKIPVTAITINSKLMESFGAAPGYADPGNYLAFLLTLVISFILILLACFIGIKFIFNLANNILDKGILGWANKVLGAGLVTIKNILIMAIILGVTFPVIETGAKMGLDSAIAAFNLIDESILAANLIGIFDLVKAFIALYV